MQQTCWNVWPDRGFLLNPDPLTALRDVNGLDNFISYEILEHIEQLAGELPTLLASHQLRPTLDDLPLYDLSSLRNSDDALDFRIVERLMQIYSYFASSYVYATDEEPAQHIPAGVAVPLHQLAQLVERPPILSYSGYVLTNWRRINPDGDIALGNIELIQQFLGNRDEQWFILVHVDIEARAAQALTHLPQAMDAAASRDMPQLEAALHKIAESIGAMHKTFSRMPEACDPDVYYRIVRPYIFGFNDVVYEGVAEYDGQPQSFRGQTGAQSSIVPALVTAFGLEHEQSGLTQHLRVMRRYMPKPHREFLTSLEASTIRAYVQDVRQASLTDAYNECLRALGKFRQLHLQYTTTYIFEKVDNPIGTGGTIYRDWLSQLVDETEAQLIS